jgi:ABC-2 type transport system permease protein
MNRLLRIARREYISYVRTVGFWLSLCAMPLLMGGLLTVPSMMDRTAPPPRLAIVDLTGQGLAAPFQAALGADSRGGAPPVRVVPAPAEALAAANPAAAGAVVRRYLAGDRAAPGGATRIDAVIVLSGHADRVAMDLWTQNLADGELESRLHGDLAQVLRRQRLIQAGVPAQLIASADRADPVMTVYSPKAADNGRVSLRDRLPALVGFGMGFLLWSTVLTGAQILMSSVIEEKGSRILEVLLSSASVPEIMGGKILGAAGVTVSVLTVWGSIAAVLLSAAGPPGLGGDLLAVLIGKGLLAYFALYLVGGYLMYASVFVAVGAYCETPRDAQTLLAPVMLMLSVPLVFMAQSIRHPDAPILAVLSWIPPFTPFLMVARAANGPPAWQIVGTLALMTVTTAITVWISGRAFRAGALSIGRVDPRAALARLLGLRP